MISTMNRSIGSPFLRTVSTASSTTPASASASASESLVRSAVRATRRRASRPSGVEAGSSVPPGSGRLKSSRKARACFLAISKPCFVFLGRGGGFEVERGKKGKERRREKLR